MAPNDIFLGVKDTSSEAITRPHTMLASGPAHQPVHKAVVSLSTLADWLGNSSISNSGHPHPVLIIDCRTRVQFGESHIVGALNFTLSSLLLRRVTKRASQPSTDLPTLEELLLADAAPFRRRFLPGCQVVLYDGTHPASGSTIAVRHNRHSMNTMHFLLRLFSDEGLSVSVLTGTMAEFTEEHPDLIVTGSTALSTQGDVFHPEHPRASRQEARLNSLLATSASLILPHLRLGSARDAQSLPRLQALGVTHVLNLTSSPCEPSVVASNIICKQLPLKDNETQDLLAALPTALAFIDEAKAAGGCVLVHCVAGVSRSAAIGIAYLIQECGLSMRDAYHVVKNKRHCVSPNLNFMGQLIGFEKALGLRRAAGPGQFQPRRRTYTSESESSDTSIASVDTELEAVIPDLNID